MPPPWHATSATEVLAQLATNPQGLSEDEASSRLTRVGPNRLTPARPVSAVRVFLDQLSSVVVLLLVVASLVSVLLGKLTEAAAIAAVLAINTLIGFMTELRARRAMEALVHFDVPRAWVIRRGRLQTIPADAIVPGDVVHLAPGRLVPADARLVDATDLRTVEAALTGESLAVSKTADVALPTETPLADRVNMVYKGTTVAAGEAHAVVTATGAATELGRVGVLVAALPVERTPLERRLDALGHRLAWLVIGVAAGVAGLGAVQGAPLALVLQLGIALAVAAVPEALPAVATIALAVGLRRMARRHALVRRLPAVEALGSTTVVCTDKTRTLTSGEMRVRRMWTAGCDVALGEEDPPPTGAAIRRALEAAALASRPQASSIDGDAAAAGDPVDEAVLRAAAQAGVDRGRLVGERPSAGLVPFSSDRKLMASFHHVEGRLVAYVKGAPRQVLAICAQVAGAGGDGALDEQTRAALVTINEDLARRGLRVLAVASGLVSEPAASALRGLTFVAFLGLMDPPARDVKATIARLRRAGLRTVMLTGDQRLTAEAIGRELGVLSEGDGALDGPALDAGSEVELQARLARVGVFSRITPAHKLAIVRGLQARGEIVAMIGDGVNDAAALRKADVGVAMGLRGADIAKEAASVVLQDDRFETIAVAVEEGRVIYDNIRKFVFYLFSCNVAEVLVLLLASLAGLPLPVLPLQILWLNLVTDTFPALALAMEPADPDVMSRPPRDPQEAILSRTFLANILAYGGLITASTLGAFVWALSREPLRATTISFMTLALAQILHLGNARSVGAVLHPRRAAANRYALAGVTLSVGLQIAAVTLDPLARLLTVEPLGFAEWIVVGACSAVPAVTGQVVKLQRSGRAVR